MVLILFRFKQLWFYLSVLPIAHISLSARLSNFAKDLVEIKIPNMCCKPLTLVNSENCNQLGVTCSE